MELLDIIGYAGAILIGLILGLIGGGGSILTVPIFVYLLGIDPVYATAYSLFVVGVTSGVGAIRFSMKSLVDYKTGIVFAIPALFSVYITRKFLVPAIPETIFNIGDFVLSKDVGIMIFFALVMLIASISMIRGRKEQQNSSSKPKLNIPIILIEGVVVGIVTGLVGAGGGFLIIPALVLLAKLPMKTAVATSLLIISAKSLIGFIGDVQNLAIDWKFILGFTALSIIGIFIGIYLSQFIKANNLKKAFGWFVLAMGIYIILKETL